MTRLIFCDLETTGLDPNTDSIVEIALVDEEGAAMSWWLQLCRKEIETASSQALSINHYWEREHSAAENYVLVEEREDLAKRIAFETSGAVLAGFNVKFDQAFLESFLRRNGAAPAWNYHVLDVATYVAGVYNGVYHKGLPVEDNILKPPFGSRSVAKALGMDPDPNAHTALADALYSKQMYDLACGLYGD